MKAFVNANPKDLRSAAGLLAQTRQAGKQAVVAGGGSDLLGMVKDELVAPDVLVNLKNVREMEGLRMDSRGLRAGGLVTLDTLEHDAGVRARYTVLAQAAGSVGTPQIRNMGTLGGNLCQRPWCWYYRAGFKCFKNGGSRCYSVAGENQFHAIFGGGPSFIVHPSDTAPALVALGASFHLNGPGGARTVPAADFFVLPAANSASENILQPDEVLAEVRVPAPKSGTRSLYVKILDREAWTHAVVSAALVMEMAKDVCVSCRIVLGGVAPIPWRLTNVEKMLAGNKITPELASRAGQASTEGARPLAGNRYKLPLTQAMVRRALLTLGA
jgi:xanthine dehydrogenase YagS FAD-binding subunit